MINQLKGYVSDNDIDNILKIITISYKKYCELMNNQAFQNVFLEEYAPHNRQFSISWAISSGFPSNSDVLNNYQIERLEYSRRFTRPLLVGEKTIILILNKTTHFNSDYLNEYYKMNSGSNADKRFCYFKFSVDHKKLTKVSLCYPNENGIVIAEEILLNRKDIELRIAS